jgi:hypothetical protein
MKLHWLPRALVGAGGLLLLLALAGPHGALPAAGWPLIPAGGPTPTATATVTPTPTPLPPSPTTTVLCDAFPSGNSSSCSLPSSYSFSFGFYVYCPHSLQANVTLAFEVGPSSNGPWTPFDSRQFQATLPPYPGGSISGTWDEPGIPAGNLYYRFNGYFYIETGQSFGLQTAPAALCGLVASPTVTPPPPGLTPTPTVTPTLTPMLTATPCPLTFSDVPPDNPFYPFVRCLACRGILSGYADGTFRPYANITRGQVAKIVSNAAGYLDAIPSTQQTFADVPYAHPFWLFSERVALHGLISGYTCGGAGEPCVPPANRPYFRPYANITRAQLAKIISLARGYSDPAPSPPTYADVPAAQPFFLFIERVTLHGDMSGYACGGPGEPCDPTNRPYFRPYAYATRGQTAKVVAQAFFPNCNTP